MHSVQKDPGPASVALVLAKMEDMLQKRGAHCNDHSRQQSDLSVYASFIRENATILGMTGAGQQLLNTSPSKITEKDGSRFLTILNRVAKGNEGVSRQERVFIHQFWSEIQKTLHITKNQ